MTTSAIAERLWARTEKAGEDECWLWTGSLNRGYGAFRLHGRVVKAHRASWEVHNGSIPSGLWVRHKCDTPRCVNPTHLFLGTALDNARDREAKGRGHDQHGEKNSNAKLTVADVRQIREEYARGAVSQSFLAFSYGVTQPQISEIVLRKSWKDAA